MASLKSKMRGNLMSSHGARKNTKNTLWVVYSTKLSRNIALASNSECIYWAACLEANPRVKSFDFGYIIDIKIEREDSFRKKEMIRVELVGGGLEFHGFSSGDGRKVYFEAFILTDSVVSKITCVSVFGDYLAEKSRAAERWLRLISYSAQIRNEVCDIEHQTLSLVVRSLGHGTVNNLLIMTEMYDPMLILGVVSRMALAGELIVDMSERPFGRNTSWRLA